MFKDSLFIALLEWEKRGKKGTFEDGKKNPKTLRFSGGGVVNFFGGLINIIYIYSSNCLKVVWKLSVPYYIFTLKNKGYCLSTASVPRWYSHTLNPVHTLNTFVETFFRQLFLVCKILSGFYRLHR